MRYNIISDMYTAESLHFNFNDVDKCISFKIKDDNEFESVMIIGIKNNHVDGYMIIPGMVATDILEFTLTDKIKIPENSPFRDELYSLGLNIEGSQFMGLTQAERELVEGNQKLLAVKSIKDRTGKGLKESKDLADAYGYWFNNKPTKMIPDIDGDDVDVDDPYNRFLARNNVARNNSNNQSSNPSTSKPDLINPGTYTYYDADLEI